MRLRRLQALPLLTATDVVPCFIRRRRVDLDAGRDGAEGERAAALLAALLLNAAKCRLDAAASPGAAGATAAAEARWACSEALTTVQERLPAGPTRDELCAKALFRRAAAWHAEGSADGAAAAARDAAAAAQLAPRDAHVRVG